MLSKFWLKVHKRPGRLGVSQFGSYMQFSGEFERQSGPAEVLCVYSEWVGAGAPPLGHLRKLSNFAPSVKRKLKLTSDSSYAGELLYEIISLVE